MKVKTFIKNLNVRPGAVAPTQAAGFHFGYLISISLALFAALAVFSGSLALAAESGYKPFIPTDPIMKLSEVKRGMQGECLTVITGREIVRFPVEVIDVLPNKGSPSALILIKTSGDVIKKSGGIAHGMSGSPMYIDGRLVGAIGYSWSFVKDDTGLVTPIEEMMKVWDYPEKIPPFEAAPLIPAAPLSSDDPNKSLDKRIEDYVKNLKPRDASEDVADIANAPALPKDVSDDEDGDILDEQIGPIFVSGLPESAALGVGASLGMKVMPLGSVGEGGAKPVRYGAKLKPGASIGASLAWGDVEIGAIGTLSAVDKDGRFIAFAHPFLGRGTTAAALTDADILTVIPTMDSPFKLGYTGAIIGTVTQDRPQGIGGRLGVFAPAASVSLKLYDADAKRTHKRAFQMMQDKFMFGKLAPLAVNGLVSDLWGRSGAGSAKVTVKFSGGALMDGWSRTNIFVSETDTAKDMLSEFTILTQMFAVNQFQELRPFGVDVDVEVTSDPRVLYIDDVKVAEGKYRAGDRVSFDVTLRPWRKPPFVRHYSLVIPEKAAGICELLVRGGGIGEEGAEYREEGWRSINNLSMLLREIDAFETNDQMILEIRGQEPMEAKVQKARAGDPSDLINDKLKSEIKAEKTKSGEMRIVRTNYYVDGLIHKLIKIEAAKEAGGKKKSADKAEAEGETKEEVNDSEDVSEEDVQ